MSGECCPDPGPGLGDQVGPTPVRVESKSDLAGSAGDPGGDVQYPVAERGDFAARQLWVVGEAEEFCPGDEICCGHDNFQPGGVRCGVVAGEVPQPGRFGLADPVLHAGVLPVP